jgi:gamma-glutamylcyclotransferase (GGCT)/AIG2-like uncharacterized protein YtfP
MFMSEFLFVYGSLRADSGSPMAQMLAEVAVYQGHAVMSGRLYEVAGYPGAVESADPTETVHGELYRIVDPSVLLTILDQYEECSAEFASPQEYIRKRLTVRLAGGSLLRAWCYVYQWEVEGLQRIVSGDYLGYR